MKKQAILGIIILFVAIWLSGCEETKTLTVDNKLFGVWETRGTYSTILMFFPDGTWLSENSDGTWGIEDSKLVITKGEETGVVTTYEYSFSDDGTMLTLKNIDDGETLVYVKNN